MRPRLRSRIVSTRKLREFLSCDSFSPPHPGLVTLAKGPPRKLSSRDVNLSCYVPGPSARLHLLLIRDLAVRTRFVFLLSAMTRAVLETYIRYAGSVAVAGARDRSMSRVSFHVFAVATSIDFVSFFEELIAGLGMDCVTTSLGNILDSFLLLRVVVLTAIPGEAVDTSPRQRCDD